MLRDFVLIQWANLGNVHLMRKDEAQRHGGKTLCRRTPFLKNRRVTPLKIFYKNPDKLFHRSDICVDCRDELTYLEWKENNA